MATYLTDFGLHWWILTDNDFKTSTIVRGFMADSDDVADPELQQRLHAMETKLKRLKQTRNSHSDSARSFASQRNAVQSQRKEIQSEIDERMAEQKLVRDEMNVQRTRRDGIQEQIRILIDRSKDGRKSHNKAKSKVVQLAETVGDIERISHRIETDGTLSLEAENRMVKKLKGLEARRQELLPDVEEQARISVDLEDIEGSIKMLRAEADAAHQAFVQSMNTADEMWEVIKNMFEDRDKLSAEADRHHHSMLEAREQADSVHQQLTELLSEVNEIRDQLNEQRLEAEKWVTDHNESVRKSRMTPDQNKDLAVSIAESLLSGGSITLGGSRRKDTEIPERPSSPKRRSRSSVVRRTRVKK